MTPPDTKELRALIEKATAGPFVATKAKFPTDGEFDFAIEAEINGKVQCIAEAFGRCSKEDRLPAETNATLIVAAINALPALLDLADEAASLRAALKEARKEIVYLNGKFAGRNSHRTALVKIDSIGDVQKDSP